MDLESSNLIDELRRAQDALRSVLDVWPAVGPRLDVAPLGSLSTLARNYHEQAHSLLVSMLFEQELLSLQQDIETLASDLRTVIGDIESKLAAENREHRP